MLPENSAALFQQRRGRRLIRFQNKFKKLCISLQFFMIEIQQLFLNGCGKLGATAQPGFIDLLKAE
ncbi:hypothetical protein BEN74_07780 [Acinetobacter sp. WCHAc010034]|nr:hypothetical protein BEN74_07780 [Acinetobacter sp. WCHAc010034]